MLNESCFDDFSKTRQLFGKHKFDYLFEEIRMKLFILKDAFKDENEFSSLVEETLLIAYQEDKILNVDSFFILFEKVKEDLRRDEELEFNADNR